jgi:hypothetical protein
MKNPTKNNKTCSETASYGAKIFKYDVNRSFKALHDYK